MDGAATVVHNNYINSFATFTRTPKTLSGVGVAYQRR